METVYNINEEEKKLLNKVLENHRIAKREQELMDIQIPCSLKEIQDICVSEITSIIGQIDKTPWHFLVIRKKDLGDKWKEKLRKEGKL